MIQAVDAFADATHCDICGRDACEDHLPESGDRAISNTVERPRLRALSAADVISGPRPAEIVEGIAWAGCVTVMVGESGAGKTFVLNSLEAAIDAGVSWHGRATLQGSVVHIGFEGDDLGSRFRALRDVQGYRLENTYVIRASDPLSPRVSRDGEEPSFGEMAVSAALEELSAALAAKQRPPIVHLTIDTVRASLAGSEDGSDPVSAYLRAVRRLLARVPGAAVTLSHHAGWQDGDTQRKRERGSSAWRGNSDATLYLETDDYDATTGEARLTLRTLKVRNGEKPSPMHLVRRRVDLDEMDRHGQPVTSCIIERDRRSREDREHERLQATQAAQRETDLAVLRAMRDYPTATSIKGLRPYVAMRTDAVTDAVARILRAGWAQEGKRGQPFSLTHVGIDNLNGHPA